MSDWQPRRMGASPPESLGNLYGPAGREVLNVCGVPVSLAMDADGTRQCEAWRRFVMGAVEPVAQTVAEELGRKLEQPALSFDFGGLWAHDLAGRAASFQKLIAGGMDVAQAAAISGLAVE